MHVDGAVCVCVCVCVRVCVCMILITMYWGMSTRPVVFKKVLEGPRSKEMGAEGVGGGDLGASMILHSDG